ncbi:hypothetical protein GCM10011349_18680 [Novosphingobium indicum]|uniref:Methylmalonyl-CoA epimerase n=1 Tax=Novosphingobium indicum TaxID=462949 RepID=A0ABQ2JLY3_9SPHN|nr:VOC family protein [Novosphingobium indicum]GGN48737.1 hypothetical protein GCM10011349_18680 [Novosphingobium indicum]
MIAPSDRNKSIVQLCWVVPDLEAAIGQWVRTTGAGPFFLFEDVHFEDGVYRGAPSDIAPHRAAIGQYGDTQIELVQPLDDRPGVWSDVVPFGKAGFHHTGLYCEDYGSEREAYLSSGAEMAFEGLMMGARTCYIDTTPQLGYLTELITANPVAAQVFGAFKAASEDWDGSEAIRTLG